MSEIVKFAPVAPVLVTLEAPPPATRLQVLLTATSIVARDLFVRVSVSAQDKSHSTWFSVPPALARIQLAAGNDLAIPVTVEVPAKTPFDKHRFRVLVADDAKPEDAFSESPLVTIECKEKDVHPTWWKKVAIGAGAAAIVAIAAAIWFAIDEPSCVDAPNITDHRKVGAGSAGNFAFDVGRKCDPGNEIGDVTTRVVSGGGSCAIVSQGTKGDCTAKVAIKTGPYLVVACETTIKQRAVCRPVSSVSRWP